MRRLNHTAILLTALMTGLGAAAAPSSAQQIDKAASGASQPATPIDERLERRLRSILEALEDRADRVRAAIDVVAQGGSSEDAIRVLGGPEDVRLLSDIVHRDPRADGRPWERSGSHEEETAQEREARERAETERVLGFLRENVPSLYERVEAAGANSERVRELVVRRLASRVAELRAAEARDAGLAEILREELIVSLRLPDVGRRLIKARQEGNESVASELEAELGALAAREVDLRLRRREHEVQGLIARAERLREELDLQRQDRATLEQEVIDRASRPFRRDGERPSDRAERRRRGG